MNLAEPADQLRFPVWLRPALAEPCKIFEDVSKQFRVSGLAEGKRPNVLGILRERKFSAFDVAREGRKAGIRRSRGFLYFPSSEGRCR